MTVQNRVYCAPEIEDDRCRGISGHVEPTLEQSPVFSSVAEMLDWALARGDEVVIRVGISAETSYWVGSGAVPEDAVPLELEEAEARLDRFCQDFPEEYLKGSQYRGA
jgi:hypothetical protein